MVENVDYVIFTNRLTAVIPVIEVLIKS